MVSQVLYIELSNSMTGCVICPNGKMLLTDKSSKQNLVILNNDGTLDKEITCSPYYDPSHNSNVPA
jgi:hypothetical protein